MDSRNVFLNVVGIALIYSSFWFVLWGNSMPSSLHDQSAAGQMALAMNVSQMIAFLVFALRPLRVPGTALIAVSTLGSLGLAFVYFAPLDGGVAGHAAICLLGAWLGVQRALVVVCWCDFMSTLDYRDIQTAAAMGIAVGASIFLVLMAMDAALSKTLTVLLPALSAILCVRVSKDEGVGLSPSGSPAAAAIPKSFLFSTLAISMANGYFHGVGAFGNFTNSVIIFGAVSMICTLIPFARKLKLIYLVSVVLAAAGLNLMITPLSSLGYSMVAVGQTCFTVLIWAVCVALAKKDNASQSMTCGRIWAATMAGQVLGIGLGASSKALGAALLPADLFFPLAIAFLILVTLAFCMNKPFLSVIYDEVTNANNESDYSARIAQVEKECRLTARESEVFELLAYGRNAKFIEGKLCISPSTVKTHMRNIYIKLNVSSHQELLSKINDGECKS